MRKPAFWKCENKGVDQLNGNRPCNEGLFSLHSRTPLLPKSEISSLYFVLSNLDVMFSGLITSAREESADFSAIDYTYCCGFC